MAESKRADKCYNNEKNWVEIDGEIVCTCCGVVLGTVYTPLRREQFCSDTKHSMIEEFCERANISGNTQSVAEDLFHQWTRLHTTLNKSSLIACSIYIACKMNNVARTLKEISAVSGCSIKQIARYEKLVAIKHYRTYPSDYVNRFATKLGLTYPQIRKVEKELKLITIDKTCNPINLAAAAIHNLLNTDVQKIEFVSGIPSSTIKRISKEISKLKE